MHSKTKLCTNKLQSTKIDLTIAIIKIIAPFKMKCYRLMLRISFTEGNFNCEAQITQNSKDINCEAKTTQNINCEALDTRNIKSINCEALASQNIKTQAPLHLIEEQLQSM